MDIQRLVIANPSGNITAIVFDPTPRARMRAIGANIQSTYPSVEQVLFVEQRGGRVHGQMAGGEFCGNAARALGFVQTQGRDGAPCFTMSGVAAPVTVRVTPNHAALTTRMAVTTQTVLFEDAPVPVVHLEGISHAILAPEHPLYNYLKRNAARPDRWRSVTHVLEDLGLSDKPACGLIFVDQDGGELGITPYVFVKDIDTLYPEMACASGSIAVARALGDAARAVNGLCIRQPSGDPLQVALRPAASGATEVTVAGRMAVLWDGPAADLEYSATTLLGRHGGAARLQRAQVARGSLAL